MQADPYAICGCSWCLELPDYARLPRAFKSDADHSFNCAFRHMERPSLRLRSLYAELGSAVAGYWDNVEIKAQEAGR